MELYRLVESAGTYPTRPTTGYVDFLGSVDPGSLMQVGDTWTQTAAPPGGPVLVPRMLTRHHRFLPVHARRR